MKLKVVACEVVFRHVCYAAAQSRHIVDTAFIARDLHNYPDELRTAVQTEIDKGGEYDAIVLGYGLCSNGAAYVYARDVPVVLPRVHDCVSLFLGSKQRYDAAFAGDPGTYYYSLGWIERAGAKVERTTAESQADYDRIYSEYCEKYGEESAGYLMETLHTWWKNYTRAGFISTGLPGIEEIEAEARARSAGVGAEYGWEFEDIPGDAGFFQRMLEETWPADEYVVARPGEQIVPVYDDRVVAATREYQPIPPRAPHKR